MAGFKNPAGYGGFSTPASLAGSGGGSPQSMKDYLASLSPAELEELITANSADYEGQEGMLGDQMAVADELRGTPTPEGRTTRNQIYTAANPLEHLGATGSRMLGEYQRKGLQDEQDALSDEKAAALKQMMMGMQGL